MTIRLQSLQFYSGGWRVRSCNERLEPTGPATHISIDRMSADGTGGYVVAVVELRDEDGPEVRWIGTRPLREDPHEFWEITKLVCELAKDLAPATPKISPDPEKKR